MKVAPFACIVLLIMASACTKVPPATPSSAPAGVKPQPPVIELAGELKTIHDAGDSVTYFLTNGQTWTKPTAQFRVAYDMSSDRTLFVAGSDSAGEFIALIGVQPGLPVSCTFALRYDGVDWGDTIESQGILWKKAATFQAIEAAPLQGRPYPNATVFCLGPKADVEAAIQVDPPDSPAPAGSGVTK